MDKNTMFQKVFEQLAEKNNLNTDDFRKEVNVIVKTDKVFFEMDTFGNNVVMRVDEKLYDWCSLKFQSEDPKNMMDGKVLYEIETKMREFGYHLSGEHIRFLYLENYEVIAPKGYTYKVYRKDDVYLLSSYKAFKNALNFKSDVIAVAAYKSDELVALAGADNFMGNMWQIGIDTIESHRGKGLGKYLVKLIAEEIIKEGAVPYYTTWSANIASMNVAVSAGFKPVWLGYYAKKFIHSEK